jgi:hypothetical protein
MCDNYHVPPAVVPERSVPLKQWGDGSRRPAFADNSAYVTSWSGNEIRRPLRRLYRTSTMACSRGLL